MPPPPLDFRWMGEPRRLEGGGLFARVPGECFTDVGSSEHAEVNRRIAAGEPWREVVDAAFGAGRPWLHRIITDPSRDRFFREVHPVRNSRVLDVGSGWGQQVFALAKAGNVICSIEPGPDRMGFIRTVARQEGFDGRVFFVQSRMQELEFAPEFDVVTCIGVLEWAGAFGGSLPARQAQRVFLASLRRCLRPGGCCVIGIENRLGLKYLLGARDDHTGLAGVSVLDADLASRRHEEAARGALTAFTYTEAEYRVLLGGAGFSRLEFHAAFPDYKVPEVILPCEPPDRVDAFFLGGGCCAEHDGFDGAPLPNAIQEDLRSHYRSLAALGIARHFAPSFFIVAS